MKIGLFCSKDYSYTITKLGVNTIEIKAAELFGG
jgi:hypothetical protein